MKTSSCALGIKWQQKVFKKIYSSPAPGLPLLCLGLGWTVMGSWEPGVFSLEVSGHRAGRTRNLIARRAEKAWE